MTCLHAQVLLAILGSIGKIGVYMCVCVGGGVVYDHLMSSRIFTLRINMILIHLSFVNYEENDDRYDLELLIISYKLCVSYHMRSRCREENV